MTNPANLSHEQILALKEQAAQQQPGSVNIHTGVPETSGGWGGRESAPRVQAPGTAEKAIAMSHLPRVTAPSPRLAERFKEREKEEAAKRLEQLEAAEAKRQAKQFADELPDWAARQDAVIARMSKQIKKLEAQLKHLGEGDACD